MKPLLLLTNDDGYYAPGLRVLWQAFRADFETKVIAPSRGKSWIGKAITNPGPLTLDAEEWDGEKIHVVTDGTPADCINLGLYHLAARKPAAVISGINNGANFTNSLTLSSGTVGGALEAALNGVLGVAVSLEMDEDTEAIFRRESFEGQEALFQPGAHAASLFLREWLTRPHDPRILLVNVIIPAHIAGPPRFIECAPLPYNYGSVFEKRGDQYFNRGRGFVENGTPILPDTDVWTIHQGHVAYTCYSGNLERIADSR